MFILEFFFHASPGQDQIKKIKINSGWCLAWRERAKVDNSFSTNELTSNLAEKMWGIKRELLPTPTDPICPHPHIPPINDEESRSDYKKHCGLDLMQLLMQWGLSYHLVCFPFVPSVLYSLSLLFLSALRSFAGLYP